MTTTIATAFASGRASEAAEKIIDALRGQLGGQEPALVLYFASTEQPLEELAPRMSGAFLRAAVLGASTAGEFTERGDVKGGVAAVAIAGAFRVHGGIGAALRKDPEAAVRGAIEGAPETFDGLPHRTALLLLDPLSGNGEETTLIAASLLGAATRLAGGAAGDDLAMKRTTVAFGERVASDAVVVALVYSAQPFGVGVCHGHEPISKTHTVTRADGATVFEVDGRPAWDVWAESTKAAAQKIGLDPSALSEDDVGAYLLRYEAGIASGKEHKIRAPLARGADGSLSFACAIPTGTKICITESVPERQIASARTAARRAREQLGTQPAGAIVFDCICRNLILSDRFSEAVQGMSEELGGVPLAGFETYGEIALDAGDLSGFHNTTTVVLAIPK